MKLIAGDTRYGALRTLAEKKSCFHEYLEDRKLIDEGEEKARVEQIKKEFLTMLGQCKVTPSISRGLANQSTHLQSNPSVRETNRQKHW